MVALGLKWMLSPESPFYVKPSLRPDLLDWGWNFYRASNPAHVQRSAPLLRDLQMASRACYEEFAERANNSFGLVKKGCLMLCNTEHRFEEEKNLVPMAAKLGLKAETLSPEDVRKLEPNIRMDIIGAVLFHDDCYLVPERFMSTLTHMLDECRVQCSWGTEVKGWSVKGDRVMGVKTATGDVVGDEYVVSGGSWSMSLLRELDVHLPMQAGKGYSVTLPRPRQLPQLSHICTEARLAVTPMAGRLRFGGTMEIAGFNEHVNPARVRGIIKSALRYYPDFTPEDFSGIQPWVGLRPLSPDGLPFLGRFKRYTNLSIGAGHAMLGLSLGPITGKLLAEVLSDERPSFDITQLDPDRYHHRARTT